MENSLIAKLFRKNKSKSTAENAAEVPNDAVSELHDAQLIEGKLQKKRLVSCEFKNFVVKID